MSRLGLDYPSIAQLNPRLVYCSISGYGQTGPSADLAAYAPVIHAASGFDRANLAHQPGRMRPDNCGVYVADVVGGTYAFGAISAALHQRNATGHGQHVDVSMLEGMLSLTLIEIQAAQFEMPPPPARPVFGPVATKNGYISLAVASERTFQGLAETADRLDWIEDPRFKKYLDRRANWGALMDEFEVWSKARTSKDCLEALARQSVPSADYRTVTDTMDDPQLAHRGAFSQVHDAGGSFKALNPPFRMSASRTKAGEWAPGLGEHTAGILEAAGFSETEIKALQT